MASPNPLRSFRQHRQPAPLTLEQLGALLGVNKSTVLRWEEGRVPAERIVEVSNITGIPREELRPDLYPSRSPAEAAE